MKIVFRIGFVLLGIGYFVACNPVRFSNNPSACTVNTPCLKGDGLLHVSQQVVFNLTSKVDILMIVDNSGSMTVEQQNISSPLNSFISNLNAASIQGTPLDWQIGVTNTDICSIDPYANYCSDSNKAEGARGRFMGPLQGNAPVYGNFVISRSSSDPSGLFASTIQRGNEVGHGDERGVYAANLAIDTNGGFFRDNSNLAVVVLSDEDERSVGGRGNQSTSGWAPMNELDQPQSLINKVQTRWNGAKSLMVNSIVIQPGDTACLNQQRGQPSGTGEYGETYANLSNLTGGAVGSICDNGAGGFGQMLQNIVGAIVNQPASKVINLAYTPASQPVLHFDPAQNQVAYNWIAGTNKIELAARPASGTKVIVEYDYRQADQTKATFKFQVNPQTFTFGTPEFSQSGTATNHAD